MYYGINNIELKNDTVTFMTKEIDNVWQDLQEQGCQISDIEIQNKTGHLPAQNIKQYQRSDQNPGGKDVPLLFVLQVPKAFKGMKNDI